MLTHLTYLLITVSRKLIYAVDITLVAQAKSLTMVENMLNEDLTKLQNYFTKWYPTLNPNKIVAIALPLYNRETHRNLGIKILLSPMKKVQDI